MVTASASPFARTLRPLLTDSEKRARLGDADLFAIAFALAGAPMLDVDAAVDTLVHHGLPADTPHVELAERLRAATSLDPAFIPYNERTFCLHRRVPLSARLRPVVLASISVGLRREAREEPPRARPARAPRQPPAAVKLPAISPVRSRATWIAEPVAKKPVAKKPVAKKPVAKKPVAKKPPTAKALAAARVATPPARVATPEPAAPRPASLAPPPVTFALLDEVAVAAALAASPVSLGELRHVLAAHALASAESFEELLALRVVTGIEPHRYQIETVRRVLRFFRGRALLADEVGLGKTIEALLVLREYELRGAVRRALVIVPPALVGQWVSELSEKAGIAARTTEDAALRADPEAFWRGPGVVVASLATARSPRHLALVHAEPWDLVIVDEAHHVKNRASASFKLVDELKSRFLLMLTATPIETELEELYNLVTLLKPGQFATPAAFRAQFVDRKDPLSPRNRERLRGLLAEVMVRNTRADSGLALPPRYVSTVSVDPLPEERSLYDDVVAFLRAHGAEPGTRMLASTLLLEAGSSSAALRGTLARAAEGDKRTPELRAELAALARRAASVKVNKKARALCDLVRAHPDQVLVFTRFRDTLAELERALREAGVAPLSFHGGLGAEAKREALAAFRDGGKVLLATDVGGEGQNLQHCHVLVNFDLPYNPMLIEQRIGRLHRMGQREEVRVYNLCARGTAEERVLDLLDRRLHLFELVVGEMDMVLGNLADERDLEDRIVELYARSRTDAEIDQGFDVIADELAAARGRYEQVKRLDGALFGKDYEA